MAEDVPTDLAERLGFHYGGNTLHARTFIPYPGEPQVKGVTDWKFFVDEEGRSHSELSFESGERLEDAVKFLKSQGYEVD